MVGHVISGLSTGGAEAMLLKLIAASDHRQFHHFVVSLSRTGPNADALRALGVDLLELHLDCGARQLLALSKAIAWVRTRRPNVLHGWMYHGNLAAEWLAKSMHARTPTIWGIRQTLYSLSTEKFLTRQVIRANAWMSKRPRVILYNSTESMTQHEDFGLRNECSKVILNGFDVEQFRPDANAGKEFRKRLGLAGTDKVIGVVARFHPMKNHEGFLRMARDIADQVPNVRFVFVGTGCDNNNGKLLGWANETGLSSRCVFAGELSQLERVYPGFDILCLPSTRGEGFPNVLGEGLLCGLPCIAFDVGECSNVVVNHGAVVPLGQEKLFIEACCHYLALTNEARAVFAATARQSIVERYSIASIARQFESEYLHCSKSIGAP